ncbi:MAG: radical SAM protein [Acidobacteria bacterium]|nr:MAG: radical SAM protein [Acidobacteriota bacterium]PYY02206.1 MAG: radical SAM protein [Acidobacteriota bacterium]PYY21233.1 MAG: radical SAM protein [Acidobacteriota bacterium]
MQRKEVFQAWGKILAGRKPALSIEITKECPLRCPGCYAYADGHVGEAGNLRDLTDYRADALVREVLKVVDEHRPLHLSIVGGDPLVRFRELTVLLPELRKRNIFVQIVTSAFRQIPAEWADDPKLAIVISIDGLQPEHDIRRRPATYARVLENIAGHRVIVHCTITSQMMRRAGYLEEFVQLWSSKEEVRKIWMSIFTPQIGEQSLEILSSSQRSSCIAEMRRLRTIYVKLDMDDSQIREFGNPPASPEECIFAQTTTTISADLKTQIAPCQLGGNPDCSQCGCVASMGLAAIGHHRVGLGVTAGQLFRISSKIGDKVRRVRSGGWSWRAA